MSAKKGCPLIRRLRESDPAGTYEPDRKLRAGLQFSPASVYWGPIIWRRPYYPKGPGCIAHATMAHQVHWENFSPRRIKEKGDTPLYGIRFGEHLQACYSLALT
ncbi:unnamed protein product [Ceratitis capitata]|uniref:(Mediterranean fruit fly) hypothetical protein n=1 Tax=Ceratitis capitata TaxID=7213 RepID=A0A811UYX2_CERCA|nr:unnamed protein product [Ceratitis capitata]